MGSTYTGRMTEQAIQHLVNRCYQNSREHGFWDDPAKNDPLIKLALITSEVGEAVEAFRKPGKSDHIIHFKGIEEELADIVIRVFDLAGAFDLRLAEAITAKMEYNEGRPRMHGGKLY